MLVLWEDIMLKKTLLLFTILVLGSACSRLEIRDGNKLNSEFVNYYNSWDEEGMEKFIQNYILVGGDTKVKGTYEKLLAERIEEKKSLEDLIGRLKLDISKNDLTNLEANMDMGIRTRATINELKKIDFTRFKIYTSKVKYNEDKAQNIVALNLAEETFYFDIVYEYQKNKWKIVGFKERR